jgi:hypothetical protein
VRAFSTDDAEAWDELVAASLNGTLLHTRRFLSYHGDRFEDCSVVITDDEGRLEGVLPAARVPDEPTTVESHPGATYGGIVHRGRLSGERMVEAMAAVTEHFGTAGCHAFRYKPTPLPYHRLPAQDDLYALFRMGASRHRCDLTAVFSTDGRGPISHGRKSAIKLARRAGVTVAEDWSVLDAFWEVLGENLERFGAAPTHRREEMHQLHDRFPDAIRLFTAQLAGEVVAGAVAFDAGPARHTQYLASSQAGRDVGALDAVIDMLSDRAPSDGLRFVDFGTSSEDGGWSLNETLYRFKRSFGAGSVVHEHYTLDLRGG